MSVPVLSVQMMLAAPSVSTASSLRTIAPLLRHALHAERERDRGDRRQAFGDRGDREAHRLEQKLVPRRAAACTKPQREQDAR